MRYIDHFLFILLLLGPIGGSLVLGVGMKLSALPVVEVVEVAEVGKKDNSDTSDRNCESEEKTTDILDEAEALLSSDSAATPPPIVLNTNDGTKNKSNSSGVVEVEKKTAEPATDEMDRAAAWAKHFISIGDTVKAKQMQDRVVVLQAAAAAAGKIVLCYRCYRCVIVVHE